MSQSSYAGKSASQRLEQISKQIKPSIAQSIGEVYIISAARTPTAKFNGALSSIPAPQLGAVALKSALDKARIPKDSISHVIMGNVLSAGVGQSPARQASIAAGLSTAVEAITVNKVCASGLKAVVLAAQNIQLGQSDAQVAGGMESMSRVPYYLPRKSQMPALGPVQADDGLQKDGLTDAYNHMSIEDYQGNARCVCDQILRACTKGLEGRGFQGRDRTRSCSQSKG
jgi:acetyl-CoA C-acetyltransferase